MKKLIKSGMALALVLTPSLSKAGTQPPLQDTAEAVVFFEKELEFKTNPYGVKKAIEGKENVVIVDLRTEEDFRKGHIPGAINIPWNKYGSFEGSETTFPGLKKNAVNIVYCYELLCNLGQKAAKKFASIGYPVKEMVGGFDQWQSHEYPVEK